jgi:hypothetical protein
MGERPPRRRGRPPAGDAPGAGPAGDDARSLLIHEEALRTAEAQGGLVESLRLRTDALIVAAAFVGSLLGGQALADGLEVWDVVGLALLLGIGVAAAVVVWPYPSLNALSARQPARDLLDADPDMTLPEVRRQLAAGLHDDAAGVAPTLRRMSIGFRVALVCLLLEIAAWLLAVTLG